LRGYEELMADGSCTPYEKEYFLPDGKRVPVILGGARLSHSSDAIIAFALDISRQKNAEIELRASLREKETLLKEIHHRVKNNLAIMQGLIRLQSRHNANEQFSMMVKETEYRIHAMSLAHELLYRSNDLAKINLADYLQNLLNHLMNSIAGIGSGIKIKSHFEEIGFGIETAISLGFILNELISNCIKYAFPDGGPGEIDVRLSSCGDGSYELIVSDNGVGMSRSDLNGKVTSMGCELVKIFVDQLNGSLEASVTNGMTVRIRFKGRRI
jgi:two-component sensor histidine kinase